jgi:hypothetical protein
MQELQRKLSNTNLGFITIRMQVMKERANNRSQTSLDVRPQVMLQSLKITDTVTIEKAFSTVMRSFSLSLAERFKLAGMPSLHRKLKSLVKRDVAVSELVFVGM